MAKDPESLCFGICWQRSSDEKIPFSFQKDPRFRILDVAWRDSKGACWARVEIMNLWKGEAYYLQIDSHHRFAQDWDSKLIEYASLTGSAKPIITTYCPAYDPRRDLARSHEPTQMDMDAFTDDGIPFFKASFIPGWQSLHRPLRARFLSGHLLFAPGSFVEEVPYDPSLYFLGEEICLSVRAHTWGYDLFHPHRTLLWHEYSRDYRRKHWDDHVETDQVELAWHQRDTISRDKISYFLTHPHTGPFACGSVRSLEEYENYAGISFVHRRIQRYTQQRHEPPNPLLDMKWWEGSEELQTWRAIIVIDYALLPQEFGYAQFWYVGVHGSNGEELHREDLSGKDLRGLLDRKSEWIRIQREFTTLQRPESWTIWPLNQAGDWIQKINGPLLSADEHQADALEPGGYAWRL